MTHENRAPTLSGRAMNISAIAAVLRNLYRSETGRRQPIRLTGRILKWQLWRGLLRVPMRFYTVTGTNLTLLPGASDSISAFWYHQIPDFEELCFALHLLESGDLFVDVRFLVKHTEIEVKGSV